MGYPRGLQGIQSSHNLDDLQLEQRIGAAPAQPDLWRDVHLRREMTSRVPDNPALEVKLEPELQGSGAVCVDRMQEGAARQAIDAASHEPRRVIGSPVAADRIVYVAAVGVVHAKLCVIEGVEGLQAELEGSRFVPRKSL